MLPENVLSYIEILPIATPFTQIPGGFREGTITIVTVLYLVQFVAFRGQGNNLVAFSCSNAAQSSASEKSRWIASLCNQVTDA